MPTEAEIESGVRSALEGLGIAYEWIEIDPGYADTAQFCEHYGYTLEESGNTIIVASKRGEKKFCACIVSGVDRLDVNKTVRRLMGVSRASFASPEDTVELTGMLIGGVTPFALPDELPIYVDEKLKSLGTIILGSGSRSAKVQIAFDELAKIPGVEFIEGLSMPPRE